MAKKNNLKEAKTAAKVVSTIRLTPEAWAWVGDQADQQDMSRNDVIVKLVDKARGLPKTNH